MKFHLICYNIIFFDPSFYMILNFRSFIKDWVSVCSFEKDPSITFFFFFVKIHSKFATSGSEEAMLATRNSKRPVRVAKTIRDSKMRENTVGKPRLNRSRNLNGPHCVTLILTASQNAPVYRKDIPLPLWLV